MIGCAVGAYLQDGSNSSSEANDLELEALRQIAVHPATRHIPYRVQSRLKNIGYAKEVLGGLVLTDDGLQRIAIDRERIRTLIEADASR